MIAAYIIVGILLAIASYFAWAYIHEMAHIIAAKKTIGLEKYELKIFPHTDPVAGFRWAACKYWYKEEPTDKQRAIISLAPRIPDYVAFVAFAFAGLMSGWLALVWAIFWGAGLVDLINGSIGYSPYSDLRKAADSLKCSPWYLRIVGFASVLISVGTTVALFFGG